MKARSNEVVGKTNNQFFSPVKPGSYMLPMYLRSSRAGTTWARQLELSQSLYPNIPAKLNLSKLRRYAEGKDWDDQCCRPLLFSFRNSTPGSTGGHVAGASAAYENRAEQENNGISL